MNEQKRPNPMMQQEEEPLNLYAIFFKYLVYWPWFVVSVLVCVVGTFVYLRYQAPVYNVKSAVLIKEQNGKTIEWTIQNPQSYVSGSDKSGKEDWYFDGNDVKAQNNTLWGDGSEKSVYDPCPYGYRVPSEDALDNLATALKSSGTFTKNDGIRSEDDNDASLYLPFSGWWQRNYNVVELCNVGTQGRLWSSTPSAPNALNNEYFSSYVLHSTYKETCKTETHVRRWGCNVRCVKIN